MSDAESIRREAKFQDTSWTLVRDASDPEQQTLAMRAMEKFCARYWYPLYAFARRKGCDREEAEDQTQEFFGRLSSEQQLADASPEEVRLRTFLLWKMQRQLQRARERTGAKKRGGDLQKLSLDFQDAEGRYLLEPQDPNLTAEALYDRAWALETLDRCLTVLKTRWESNGKGEEFAALRPFVSLADAGGSSGAEVAEQLGISVGNVRQKVKRLRAALSDELHEQVAASLADPSRESVSQEIKNLRAAIGGD